MGQAEGSKGLVLVIGASSGIGLATVKCALAAGFPVRAFARRASSIQLEDELLEKFAGDALNPQDVQAALQNTQTVIQTLGVPFNLQLLTGPITLFSQATAVLLTAMQRAGVSRLLAVTGFGAGESEASIHVLQRLGFKMVFGRAYQDKSEQERLIKDSHVDWTIIRPGVLTNGPMSGSYQVLEKPDEWRNGVISRADVADYLVKAIDDRKAVGASPVLINWKL
jgi:putative NADH-flavin reductase